MNKRINFIVVLVVCTTIGAAPETSHVSELHLDHCLVTAVADVELAAPMSGVIKSINVFEGDNVSRENLVMQIDDTQAEMGCRLAEMNWRQAHERHIDSTAINVAVAEANVAKSEHERALKTNQMVPDAIAQMQVERLEMERQKATINVERARFTQKQAAWDAELRKKEWDQAKALREQHQLKTSLEGQIVKIHKSAGEWAQQGEAIARVVKMDQLHVDGYIDLTETDVVEVMNRPVIVFARLANNRKVTLEGQIILVNPLVEAGERVRVRAQVVNRKENDAWVLLPGMAVGMTIDFDNAANQKSLTNLSKQMSRQ